MPKAGMETNIGEVYQQFLDFNQKEMRQALRGGITNAANQLRSGTKRNVRAMLPAARNYNPRFDDTMLDAVKRSKIIETKKGEMSTKVHIMGTRATGSGTYRLRFFEKGTRERYTRTGHHYRGRIVPLWFFRTANQVWESQYDSIMDAAMAKAIQKTNAKRFK